MKGCTNQVVRVGVCRRHGAGRECSVDCCTNYAKSGGVCVRHGRINRLAASKDAQISLSAEECERGIGERSKAKRVESGNEG